MIKKPHGAQKQLEVKMKRHGGTKKKNPILRERGSLGFLFGTSITNWVSACGRTDQLYLDSEAKQLWI